MIIGFANREQPIRISITGGVKTASNGTSTVVTPSIIPVITDGFRPYTYDWTDNFANVFVQVSNSSEVWFRATGTDVQHNGQCTLILTEANGFKTTTSVTFVVNQGTPP